MVFNEFIENITEEDKMNFSKYSKIRGRQQYIIIYETLKKIDKNVSYNDVNAFIKYDKAIKDVLYKYLGTVEESIKTFIFENYDFEDKSKLDKEEYRCFKKIPKLCKKQNCEELTELYKRFSLSFGGIIKLLKKYEKDNFNCSSLDKVVELRNKVMHHRLLLFTCKFESDVDLIKDWINDLIDNLPGNYKSGILTDLIKKTNATKENINPNYQCCLLSLEEK